MGYYLHIDGDNVEKVEDMPRGKKKHEACMALDRAMEELQGFLKYKGMDAGKKEEEKRYALASMQEFQHLLLALDDFFTALQPELNTDEKVELMKFFRAITPTV